MTAVDLDLAILLIPAAGVLLGAAMFAVAMLWARVVESALAATSAGVRGASDNPTVLFQPPEDAPIA
jgi:hypothetical protein